MKAHTPIKDRQIYSVAVRPTGLSSSQERVRQALGSAVHVIASSPRKALTLLADYSLRYGLLEEDLEHIYVSVFDVDLPLDGVGVLPRPGMGIQTGTGVTGTLAEFRTDAPVFA